MKLAVIYNVFDAEELLPHSIESIKNVADTIIIMYQTTSNVGNKHPDENFLNFLYSMNVDVFVKYDPQITDHPHSAEKNERYKRALGCKKAIEYGCTHYLLMDCDEFYEEKQFISAKKAIQEFDYDSSACMMNTYYKKPTYKLVPNEQYYVPFICKLQKGKTRFANFPNYPVVADPSRKSSPFDNFKKFKREELIMHHYTAVRKNILTKLKNHSTLNQPNMKNALDYVKEAYDFNNFQLGDNLTFPFQEYNIEEVENQFNIPESFDEPDEMEFEFLKKICSSLNVEKFDYWLSSGTYLSLYRENRFFPWDIDIDIDLLGDGLDMDKLMKTMSNLGLSLYKKNSDSGKTYQIIFKTKESERLVDFYIWYKNGNRLTAHCDVGTLYYTKEIYESIQDMKFRGFTIRCPEPNKYFSLRYGSDWRIPKKVSGLAGGGWKITKNLIWGDKK